MQELGQKNMVRQESAIRFMEENPLTSFTLCRAWNMCDADMMDMREDIAGKILGLCKNIHDMQLAAFHSARSGTKSLKAFLGKLTQMVRQDASIAIRAADLGYQAYKDAGYPKDCQEIFELFKAQQAAQI